MARSTGVRLHHENLAQLLPEASCLKPWDREVVQGQHRSRGLENRAWSQARNFMKSEVWSLRDLAPPFFQLGMGLSVVGPSCSCVLEVGSRADFTGS